MKMRKNKRGIWVLNLAEIFPLIIFMALVSITIIFLVFSAIKFSVESFDAEAQIFATSLVYSKDGLAYYDAAHNRVYPGYIDLTSISIPPEGIPTLTSEVEAAAIENLEKKMEDGFWKGGTKGKISAHIKIWDASTSFFGIDLYYNKELYDKWSPIAGLWSGPGGAHEVEIFFPVITVYQDGSTSDGVMEIRVVGPNT